MALRGKVDELDVSNDPGPVESGLSASACLRREKVVNQSSTALAVPKAMALAAPNVPIVQNLCCRLKRVRRGESLAPVVKVRLEQWRSKL